MLVLLLITVLAVGCIETEMSQSVEAGYEVQTRYTEEGEVIHYYNITSDGYYFKPGSRLYEEVPFYDKTTFKTVFRTISYIELTSEGFTRNGYRLQNGNIMGDIIHERYFASEEPIKIDLAIAAAKRLDEQFKEEGLDTIYLTKDGETVEPYFIVLDLEEYVLPYGAMVGYRHPSTGHQGYLGRIEGIDPSFKPGEYGEVRGAEPNELDRIEKKPAYFTDSFIIGTSKTEYKFEVSEKPIKGNISDVIQNPEKYGYPKESIGKMPKNEVGVKIVTLIGVI